MSGVNAPDMLTRHYYPHFGAIDRHNRIRHDLYRLGKHHMFHFLRFEKKVVSIYMGGKYPSQNSGWVGFVGSGGLHNCA